MSDDKDKGLDDETSDAMAKLAAAATEAGDVLKSVKPPKSDEDLALALEAATRDFIAALGVAAVALSEFADWLRANGFGADHE